ncbi:MAG: NAD(P)-binding protein [Clostridia bacterium]|nr:NAD(P)-binding protein [Clostridia bacterium]MDR3645188.1 NAD(P)-binding protein [Clostridia bacterium]
MMYDTMIIGGGIAGCVCAGALACEGLQVILVEKEPQLGGKVAKLGCKATDACSNCGVCLSAGLWEKTASDSRITVCCGAWLLDCRGGDGGFEVTVSFGGKSGVVGAKKIVVATGYTDAGVESGTHVELSGGHVLTGAQLETMIRDRAPGIFAREPGSIAFLQCYGSRDKLQKALYCSRVCCAYAARSARLVKMLYPGCRVDMYFMDIQRIGRGCSEDELAADGINILRGRPEKVVGSGGKVVVRFEHDGIRQSEYDCVVLSCGIAPGKDNEWLGELFGLGTDQDGFLTEVLPGDRTGVYIAGCAKGPGRIEEAYADALGVAARLCGSLKGVASA